MGVGCYWGRSPGARRRACRWDGDGWARCPTTGSYPHPLRQPVYQSMSACAGCAHTLRTALSHSHIPSHCTTPRLSPSPVCDTVPVACAALVGPPVERNHWEASCERSPREKGSKTHATAGPPPIASSSESRSMATCGILPHRAQPQPPHALIGPGTPPRPRLAELAELAARMAAHCTVPPRNHAADPMSRQHVQLPCAAITVCNQALVSACFPPEPHCLACTLH